MANRVTPAIPPAIDSRCHRAAGFVEQVRPNCEDNVSPALATEIDEFHPVTIGVVGVLDSWCVFALGAWDTLDMALAVHDVKLLDRPIGFLEVQDAKGAALFQSGDKEIGRAHREATTAAMQARMNPPATNNVEGFCMSVLRR